MKITFEEEIESHKAWFESMYCCKCGEGIYKIHHQLQPKKKNSWWIECDNCGYESIPTETRSEAIHWWKQSC